MSLPKCEIGAGLVERSRVGETATFLRRAMLFLEDLKKKRYPNASTLARACRCSRSTAMRTIDRLRYEFGVPIEYEDTHRGYYLTQADFTLSILPPSRDELFALCVVSDLATLFGDTSIRSVMDGLWTRVAIGRSDVERERVREKMVLEAQVVSHRTGVDMLQLLGMCHYETLMRVRYRSPWMQGDGVEYIGRFERMRVANARAHGIFVCVDGTQVVLNASFIVDVRVLNGQKADSMATCPALCPDDAWYAGHGRWSGSVTEAIEVTIAAPASRYYGAQIWQADQEDFWEGDTLTRRFSSVISVELAERILSLGRAIVSVRPEWVLEELKLDVANLSRLCAIGVYSE